MYQCPWEMGSVSAERVGQGGGGLMHPKCDNSMAVSGLGCENPSVEMGEPFLSF